MSTDNKYRLVTRADFDGIVAGGLLMELDMISEVIFAEPKSVQDGLVEISANDITTNLPYSERVHLCFDHHISELERVGTRENYIISPDAPSAARVVFDYFGGKGRFPGISEELMDAVDKADSAGYSEEDILAPERWTLLNFLLDPRTGLSRFEHFEIGHEEFMKDMMVYVRHHPVDEILAIPAVKERVYLYQAQEEQFELQLRATSKHHGSVTVLDMRNERVVHAGNRFTAYAIFPECNVSIQIMDLDDRNMVLMAVGKSILNRTNDISIGSLMLEYGGGGHRNAGTCQIEPDDVDRVLSELIARVSS